MPNQQPSIYPNKQKQIIDLLLLFTTVALFYLAFPSGGLAMFAWCAITPILIALKDAQPKYAFILGLTAATLGWMASIWWVTQGLADITNSQLNIFIPFVFLFCLISAIPYAISAWLYCRFKLYTSILGAIQAAAIITVLSNYIPHLLPGNLAHALYLAPEQIQLASVGGIAAVFFVIHCINFLLAYGISHTKSSPKSAATALFLVVLVWASNWLYGQNQIYKTYKQVEHNKQSELSVALVQPNMPITLRTRQDWLSQASAVESLIQQAASQSSVDLIVLPEVPVPISHEYYQFDRRLFNSAANNTALFIAGIEPVNSQKEPANLETYYNSVELIQNKQVTARYHKQKLLPMAEYLPFEQQLPILRRWFPYAPDYQSGAQIANLALALPNNNISLIPLICYEAVFTDLVATGINSGGQLMVNAVNDAWFGNTAGRDVHFALAVFRTIEFRTPLVRVTNNGHSAAIDASGTLIEQSLIPPNTSMTKTVNLPLANITSFYQKYPNFFTILCLLVAISVGLRGVIKRDQYNKPN